VIAIIGSTFRLGFRIPYPLYRHPIGMVGRFARIEGAMGGAAWWWKFVVFGNRFEGALIAVLGFCATRGAAGAEIKLISAASAVISEGFGCGCVRTPPKPPFGCGWGR
jgi:hypothetical protein